MNSFNDLKLKEKEKLYIHHTREAGKSFTTSMLTYSTIAFFGWNPLILGVTGISLLQGLGHLFRQQENYPVYGEKIKIRSVCTVDRDKEFTRGIIDGILLFGVDNILNLMQTEKNGQNTQ